MTESILGWQLFYFISMYFGTLLSYLLPIYLIELKKKSNDSMNLSRLDPTGLGSNKMLSYCNCCAAGIFLGICFLNLIPYVNQEFNELFEQIKWTTDYPVGLMSVILGLFLVLFLEFIVLKKNQKKKNQTPVLYLDEDGDGDHDQLREELLNETELNQAKLKSHKHDNHHDNHHHHHHHHHGHSHDMTSYSSSSGTISFLILMFATSVHSVFEGLALGLQQEATKSFHLFIGIILHECLVAFAIGLNSARLDTSMKSNIKFAMAFSLTIPIGIILGVALGYTPGVLGKIISSVFQGLAAGTFIHVTFHELIPTEFNGPDGVTFAKLLLLFIGFVIIAIMTWITGAH